VRYGVIENVLMARSPTRGRQARKAAEYLEFRAQHHAFIDIGGNGEVL
jgi:hypothetical protein